MTDFQDRFLADIGRYEAQSATKVLAKHLRNMLGDEDVEGSPIKAYLLNPTIEVFRAFIVTPDRFITLEMNPDAAYLISAMPLERVSRIHEAGTAESVTVTIEMDADITTIHTDGRFGFTPDPTAISEAPITRGDFVSDAITRPANYKIVVATSESDPLSLLLEFSAAFRAALGS